MCTYFETETDAAQNLIDDFFKPWLSEDSSIGKILSKKNMGIRGYFLKKTEALLAELNERAEAATCGCSAEVDFLQYIYSVLVAKNH